MMNLAEYRCRSQSLSDFLPWAALVREGVVLNKDGSFQRTARFRGPDLDSSTESELVAVSARLNNALRRLGSGWALFVEADRRAAAPYPPSTFPDPVSWLVDEERRAERDEVDGDEEVAVRRVVRRDVDLGADRDAGERVGRYGGRCHFDRSAAARSDRAAGAARDRETGADDRRVVLERRVPGVRLLQAGYHIRSLSLYTKLGFVTREPLAVMQGAPLDLQISGYAVRRAVEADLQACDRVCFKVHGLDRSVEVLDAIKEGTATVVEHDGDVTAYATVVGFFGHAVGETNDGLKALIGAATVFAGPGFLLPMRNWELFRWCLDNGLRVVEPMTLMSVGLYNDPVGAFLPSVLY